MSDVLLNDNGKEDIAGSAVREESVADAVAALQLILLAVIAELEERGALDTQVLAYRLRGTFPEDAEDSLVKGLVEVFGRRLEIPEKAAPEKIPEAAATSAASEEVRVMHVPAAISEDYCLIEKAS